LLLDRTSLQELLTMIEDTYGLRLQVSDNELLDLEMSGRVPAENLDTLIQDISAIYRVNFKNY
jgi:transmembrane sensor